MKIALVLPYFGKFDSLFPLWLESCRYNSDIDWLLFTDDKRNFNYPHNVKVVYIAFEALRDRIQCLYDFPVALDSPYRLCNFRPAFGEIFEKELNGYDAWGFCDNDMIFGQLIPNFPMFKQKFKGGAFGHLSFVPNTDEVRTLYRYHDAYKIAFSNSELLFFDENTFPKILESHGYEIYHFHIADFQPRRKNFRVLNEPGLEWKNKAHCFVWSEGKLWRYYIGNQRKIEKEEYVYIHFLKRPIAIDKNLSFSKPVVIVPNRIFNIDYAEITPDFLKKNSANGIFWAYWKNSFKPKNFVERVKNRLFQNKRNRTLINKMNHLVLK